MAHFLIAIVLLLSETLNYDKAVARLMQCLKRFHPDRGSTRRFSCPELVIWINNPVRANGFTFHTADEVLEDSEAIVLIRQRLFRPCLSLELARRWQVLILFYANQLLLPDNFSTESRLQDCRQAFR